MKISLSDATLRQAAERGVDAFLQTVVDAIADHAGTLLPLLDRGAHVYLCGNKAHLEQAVSGAVNTLMEGSSELAADDTGWKLLQRQGRLHLELY